VHVAWPDDGGMTKQIAVGYDGSQSSAEAVLWAAAEAATRGARLRIVSCYEIPLAGDSIGGWNATEAYSTLMDGCRVGLVAIRDVVANANPEIDIDLDASAGPTSDALVDGAGPDDLIVVGASGHHGAAAFWLGSTPRHVVRHSPCPVVVVRGATSRGRPDRVVVGIDGSPASERALRWAGDEADRHGVSLLVVHGWLYPYLAVDTASSQARDLTNVDAACVLERAVESARAEFGADVDGELVEAGSVTALLETVRDGDLLVVGSRGRGALAANLFGSTVNSVLDQCPVPVAVVRGSERTD
jgi:nucleotide-binding universal stress UspA family protein